MNIKFTSEELKNIIKQPKDSCPHLNYALQKIESENTTEDAKKNVEIELNEAGVTIFDIIEWQQQWKNLFENNKHLDDNDVFVEAYVHTAESLKDTYPKFDLKTNISELISGFEDYQDEIFNKKMCNDLVEFSKEEKEENDLFIDMKKKSLSNKIEEIRSYAINQREIGRNYKEAYKQISLNNELNDIIQPQEIIMEEQNPSDVFILGVLNHEKTTDKLIHDELITDVEGVLFSKMNSKNKIDFIKTKLKEKGQKQEKIAYYENLEDFQNKNKYKTTLINEKQKNKVKRKNS